MGLLALDVSRFGIVMSADSQPVALLDGRNRVLRAPGTIRNNPIIVRRAGGFTGLVGYIGRHQIGAKSTRGWLEHVSDCHPTATLAEFAHLLADSLASVWHRQRLKCGLWIFLSGIEGREVRFWYVNNIEGLNLDGTYIRPGSRFRAVNDLDENYISKDLTPGQTKEDLLHSRIYSFRNGVLRPSALIFDVFSDLMQAVYAQQISWFTPIRSLTDLAYFDRQRMEFVKRLYSPKHGISRALSAAIGGEVHVMGVARDGKIMRYSKVRSQVRRVDG